MTLWQNAASGRLRWKRKRAEIWIKKNPRACSNRAESVLALRRDPRGCPPYIFDDLAQVALKHDDRATATLMRAADLLTDVEAMPTAELEMLVSDPDTRPVVSLIAEHHLRGRRRD